MTKLVQLSEKLAVDAHGLVRTQRNILRVSELIMQSTGQSLVLAILSPGEIENLSAAFAAVLCCVAYAF